MNDEVVKDASTLEAAREHASKAADHVHKAGQAPAKGGEPKLPGWQLTAALAEAEAAWEKRAKTEHDQWGKFADGIQATDTALTNTDESTATMVDSVGS
ncbi:hypothetical protein LX16_4114 [Stackebrandtia albiflava]|uniref:Uncharacterized protein n=1 Tax=Stackebrandtia albiflava TaxID=406432 RepID=A0A562UYH7_9ACTN|nr:hypothetical protein [Stackebrandtia albiflava]TWJ10694.1 hypothetical protein LX16_4114 [Stackebrandtia albiflava]